MAAEQSVALKVQVIGHVVESELVNASEASHTEVSVRAVL